MKFTIIFDNYKQRDPLKTGWGFSAYIEADGEAMLFDTGANYDILFSNAFELNLDLSKPQKIVISHFHWDHTGGLWDTLSLAPGREVYGPSPFPPGIKERIELYKAEPRPVPEKPTKIADYAISTGTMDGHGVREHSLILANKVLITGCAHPGIVEIVKRAIEITGHPPELVVGGFHLGGFGSGNIQRIALEMKELGVEKVAPCHCSGVNARKIFAKIFGDNFIPAGVGFQYELG